METNSEYLEYLEYIEPDTNQIKHIRELLKKQGKTVCKNQINTNAISESASKFTFGWVQITPKGPSGKSVKSYSDKFLLKSFILCMIDKDAPSVLKIECVCSSTKKGKELMQLAEEKAKELGLKRIILMSLLEDQLKGWYESLGYSYIMTMTFVGTNAPKMYYMEKFIG